jgi:hypothetical protein
MAKGYKTGGRQKGTPNKVSLKTREQLWVYLDQHGTNPFAVLADMMRTTTDEKLKVTCASVLADRLLPRLKAVELSGDQERPLAVQLTQEQRQARIATLLGKRNGHTEGTP